MSKTTTAVVDAGPEGRVATLCAVARAMGFGDGALGGIAVAFMRLQRSRLATWREPW